MPHTAAAGTSVKYPNVSECACGSELSSPTDFPYYVRSFHAHDCLGYLPLEM